MAGLGRREGEAGVQGEGLAELVPALRLVARDEWLRLVGGVQALDSADGRATLVRSSEVLVDTFERLTASYEHSLQVIMS